MKIKYVFFAIVLISNLISSYMIFYYAPSEAGSGNLYKIFYFHVPTAWVSYLAFGVTMLGSIMFLLKRSYRWDLIAAASAQLGIIFCGIALVLGAIWAGVAWKSYWNWDPRETTTLILWIMYMAYLSFRASIQDLEKRANLSAVVGILAFICVPLSYLSIKLWFSVHSFVIQPSKIGLTTSMLQTLLVALFAVVLIYLLLLKITLNVWEIEEKVMILKHKLR